MAVTREPYKKLIITLSILIPLTVSLLFGVKIEGYDFTFLPPIYASINGATAFLLMVGLWAIKNKKRNLHENLMKTSIGLSALFLVLYILYHITSDSTTFGGTGLTRYLYFFILISHILLSIIVVPLILFTLSRAIAGDFEKHKALARFTLPIWIYVAVTGVIVYFMISPYYK